MSALTAGQLAMLRTTRHATRLALAVYAPATIWTGRVNGDHAIRATSIAFNTGSGTTPAANYEIWFGSTSGAKNIGVGRVKSHPGGASGTLTIAPNNFDLSNGDYITVKANIQPQAVQPNCGTTIYEDWDTAYTDQNTYLRPLARMGPPACAYIDPATGLATLKFYSSSVAMYGSLSSYLWTLPGATYVTGNSTTAGTSASPNVVTWDTAGQYWCSLRVTDSRGNTHTTYRPVFIFDRFSGTLPYTSIEVGALEGSQDGGGWTTTLTVRGTADASAFPDLAQVVLFARDFYGDTETSIGGDYVWRENIVFVGFIRAGSVKAHAWNQSVEFQAVGIGVLVENLPGYAFNLDSGSSGWHAIPSMTYALAAYHILTEHSTLDLIADVDLSPVSYTAQKIDFVASSLRDQIAQQCLAPVRSLFGSSRTGRIYARQNPQLVAAASRTEDVVLDTDDADFRDTVDIVQERTLKETAQLDFNGFNFTGNGEQTPVLSLAPGSPYTNGRFERLDGIRVTDQSDSNIVSGYFEGRANNAYPDIALKWRGNYRVFDAFPIEKVRLNLTTAQNNRGLAWSNAVMWIKRVAMTYRNGSLVVDTNCEMDVVGAPGITGNYPSVPPTVDPPIEPPTPVDPPPVVPPPPRPQGRGELIYTCAGNTGSAVGGIAKIVNGYSTDAPTITRIDTGTTAAQRNWYSINFDPFSFGTQFTTMVGLCQDGLYKLTGLDGVISQTKILDDTVASTLLGVSVTLGKSWTFNVRTKDEIIILAYGAYNTLTANRHRVYVLYSTDGGSNWSGSASKYALTTESANRDNAQIIASYHTTGAYWMIGSIYGTEAGTGIYLALKATALPNFSAHYGIVNPGVPIYFGAGSRLAFPFIGATGTVLGNDNLVYLYGTEYSNSTTTLQRFDTFEIAATPVPTPAAIGDTRMSWGFSTVPPYYFIPYTFNANVIFGARGEGAYTSNQHEIWLTTNGGATWTLRNPSSSARVNLNGPVAFYATLADENIFYCMGHSAVGDVYLLKTLDFGATWVDISNYGTANYLDTVLGTSNYAAKTLLVDYYKE